MGNTFGSRPTGSPDTIQAKFDQRRAALAENQKYSSADSLQQRADSRRQQMQAQLQRMTEILDRQLHPLTPAKGPR
ncbi:MAG: hypothetical protein U0931_37210 [Vulcanimicrobiota bacterium]